jgi:hypothetical protein
MKWPFGGGWDITGVHVPIPWMGSDPWITGADGRVGNSEKALKRGFLEEPSPRKGKSGARLGSAALQHFAHAKQRIPRLNRILPFENREEGSARRQQVPQLRLLHLTSPR